MIQDNEHLAGPVGAARAGDGSGAAVSTDSPLDAAFVVVSINERLRALETGTKDTHGHWYNSQAISTIIGGIFLAVIGYLLTGRIAAAAKEREINATNATEMQGLLAKISTGTAQEAEAAAVSLTTFGRYSVPPLIAYLQSGPERALAAERGLETLALTNASDVCGSLERVLENRTQLYTAQSHTAAIRIMGEVECRAAIPTMKRYAVLVRQAKTDPVALKAYQEIVRDATASNVDDTDKELAKTFRLLHVQ